MGQFIALYRSELVQCLLAENTKLFVGKLRYLRRLHRLQVLNEVEVKHDAPG